jgi:general secretion pathway protein I
MPVTQDERGFTLLEILAALTIAAIGIAAVMQTAGNATSVLQQTEDRLLASWVASNRLTELKVSRVWPAAVNTDGIAAMGGRNWHYRQSISTTQDPDLLRADISVFTDTDHQDRAAKLFGYLARVITEEAGSAEQ